MKAAPLILFLLLTAAPASAGENMFSFLFQGRDCDEPRGVVSHWPEVRRARAIERLCLPQQLAIYESDKVRLEATSPSLYRPSYTAATAPAEPAPAPPPPSVPTAPIGRTTPAEGSAPR